MTAAFGFGFGVGIRQRRRRAVLASFDFTGGAMPAGATLTRASAGTRVNQAGAVVSEVADVARFDYAAGALRGLLVEQARTNMLLRSEALASSPWSFSGASAASDVAVAPDGATTADKLRDTAVNTQHRAQQVVTASAGSSVCLSAFFKAAERSRLRLRLIGATTFADGSFNLANGAVISARGSFEPIGNGWFRLAVWGIADQASVTAYINLLDNTGDVGNTTYLGDGSAGALIWGAQIEGGAGAGSYIATAAATAARAADVLTLAWGGKGVPDGDYLARYTFDDRSTVERVLTVSGGAAAVPTNLPRAALRSVDLLAA